MSATPWVKWFSGDFLNGVADLEADEGWVYVIALNLIYDRGGPIPFEPDRLARRCRLRRNVVERVVRQLVDAGKLTMIEGKLSNPKAERMLKGRLKASEDSSEAARIRWEKERENKGGDDATAMPSQCDRNAIPESRIQKLESPLPPKGEKKTGSSKTKATTIPDGFPDVAALQVGRDMVIAAGVAVHVRTEADKFRDYALGRGGSWKKVDWLATWRNWIRSACERAPSLGIAQTAPAQEFDPWPDRARSWMLDTGWNSVDWGPNPDQPGCKMPRRYIDEALAAGVRWAPHLKMAAE